MQCRAVTQGVPAQSSSYRWAAAACAERTVGGKATDWPSMFWWVRMYMHSSCLWTSVTLMVEVHHFACGNFWSCSFIVFLWWVSWGWKRPFMTGPAFPATHALQARPQSSEWGAHPKESRGRGKLCCLAEEDFVSSLLSGLMPNPLCCSVSLRKTSSACLKAANGSESSAFLVKLLK